MKKLVSVLLVACALVVSGYAQSSLFDRYDIQSTNWAKLPSGGIWDGETPAVATDSEGTVVVLVRKAPHFRFFKSDGTFIKGWGDDGNTNYHSVYFGPDHTVWLAATNNHVLMKFSPDGELLMTLGKRGVTGDNASREAFNRPNAVAFGKNGEIFVSDGYVNSRIVEFTKDGHFVRIIGGVNGNGPGELDLPHAVAIDAAGRILVADSGNKRVSVFAQDGKFVESWPAPGQGGLAVGSDGTVYVSDVNAGAVVLLKDGKIVDAIHIQGRPHALSFDVATNEIYVASTEPMKPNVIKITRKKAASN
jgi:sugar lactone lactonase YvrE